MVCGTSIWTAAKKYFPQEGVDGHVVMGLYAFDFGHWQTWHALFLLLFSQDDMACQKAFCWWHFLWGSGGVVALSSCRCSLESAYLDIASPAAARKDKVLCTTAWLQWWFLTSSVSIHLFGSRPGHADQGRPCLGGLHSPLAAIVVTLVNNSKTSVKCFYICTKMIWNAIERCASNMCNHHNGDNNDMAQHIIA